ncbi:MAG: sigma-70 family RNA polymerase sigma factor [Planctomycetaceae bacterium]|nr:sigma-70 family RNA polymerase sigma factor [Planctomycetaceae bacterium]
MSQPPASTVEWLQALLDGDEQTVAEFWEQYGQRLNRLAERHLSPRLSRRVGADDVVQSVCRTFFRRAREEQFELSDAEALWRLLCVITLTKCRLVARFHGRRRRGLDREQPLDGKPGDTPQVFEAVAPDLSPDRAAEIDDELKRLLAALDPEEQQFVDLKLQEHTNGEIARQIGCSERTVRRVFQRVQSRLRDILKESSRDLT